MKAEHTKGPWKATQWEYTSGPPRKELVIENGQVRLATLDADFVGNNPYVVPLEEAEANARLIAAAPKLLDACKQAHAFLCSDVPTPSGRISAGLALEAALALAEKGARL